MQPHVDTPRAFAHEREALSPSPRLASPRSAALVRAYAANDATLENVRAAKAGPDTHADGQHATASNGFGDTLVPTRADALQQYRIASRVRSRLVGDAIVAACVAIARGARNAWTAYRQRRVARATRLALDAIDDHMLHDLGLDRSETSSIGAEVAGRAERTRMQTMLASHGLYR